MTERSYYHDGAVAGDASEAPYTSELYSKISGLIYSSLDGYVFPLQGNELNVFKLAGPNPLTVDTGYAMIGGVYYSNTAAIFFTISANYSTYGRYDRVVIRVDWNTQTVRAILKTGRPSSVPVAPDIITDIGNIYEMPLARIYIPAGYSGVGGILSILDEREFAFTALHENTYVTENTFPDSEFMSFVPSSPLASSSTRFLPCHWKYSGTIVSDLYPVKGIASEVTQMDRGNYWDVFIASSAISNVYWEGHVVRNTTPVVFRLLVNVISGTLGIQDDVGTITIEVPPTNGFEVVTIRTEYTAANPNIVLYLFGGEDNSNFQVGQITMTYGKLASPFGVRREIIVYGSSYSLLQETISADGNYVPTLAYDIPKGSAALLGEMDVTDTASAGTDTCYASFVNNKGSANQLRSEIGRRTNNYKGNNLGILGFDQDTWINPTLTEDLKISADRAGTMAVWLTVVGIVV